MKNALLGALFACALIQASHLHASQAFPATFDEMFSRFGADALVRAEVADKAVVSINHKHIDEWGRRSEGEMIFTRYSMVLADVVHGEAPPARFDLYLPGGEVNGESVHHTLSFDLEVGWDVVLFLDYEALNDMYHSAGTRQATFVVHAVNGRQLLINLKDGYPPQGGDAEVEGRLRRDLRKDDPVYAQDGSRVLSYEILKSLFEE